MKPQSCRNCGKELFEKLKKCPHCDVEFDSDDTE